MKFTRLGIIAAMAMALCGQQALAADAPAAKQHPTMTQRSNVIICRRFPRIQASPTNTETASRSSPSLYHALSRGQR